jgi:hypothetical protein
VFSRIHCSFGRFISEFGRFIDKIVRYSSVGNFTVHIFNQMNFGRFFTEFYRIRLVFRKPTELEAADFLVSASFLNTGEWRECCRALKAAAWLGSGFGATGVGGVHGVAATAAW